MSFGEIFDVSAAVLTSIGGAGVIILGLSSWLGKVWATRLMDSERHQHQQNLTLFTEGIKNTNNVELEKLKARIDSISHVYKLDKTHKHEQRKKIKEVISKNKVSIIDSAETLNHRMWNFNENHEEQWHTKNDDTIENQYYLYSFVYRILVFFSWCNTIEKEMIYLDSTIADEQDLDFVKFLKLFPQIMCDVMLFDGLEYDHSSDTDHFFKNNFQSAVDKVHTDDGVLSFNEFKKKIEKNEIDVNNVIEFISGISPNEDRLRWFRLQAMHYALLMFINTFGYDFQYTSASRIKELMRSQKDNPTLINLSKMIAKFKLEKSQEVKQILDALSS